MNNKNFNNGLTSGLIFILAIACGGIVANLYYAQTLIATIGSYLNINLELAGLIVTLTQIGYCAGLLFIVPLADIIENKKLIILLLCAICICLIGLISTNICVVFLLCCFMLGLTAVAAQVIVPFVAHFTPIEKRGKIVGNVMSGLLLGIMLARPAASFVSALFSWQYIFVFSIALMLIVAILLYFLLPSRAPEHKSTYAQLICSLPVILRSYPVLRKRALYHAVLFGVFSLFWTSIAMLLMGNEYHYSQSQVALFAFVGAIGAFVAPIAGRMADSGYTRIGTGIAITMVGIACILAKLHGGNIVILVIAALLLDAGVSCNLVLGQRAIYALAPEVRGRLNGLYMAIFFMGGAVGSGLAGYLYANGGWDYITTAGVIVSILILIYFTSEYLIKEH